jgi:hypothetical protein
MRLVQQTVGQVIAIDFDPLFAADAPERMNLSWPSKLAESGVRMGHGYLISLSTFSGPFQSGNGNHDNISSAREATTFSPDRIIEAMSSPICRNDAPPSGAQLERACSNVRDPIAQIRGLIAQREGESIGHP